MLSNTEVAEVLRDAVDVIDRQGWCQNELKSDDGRVCLWGAIGEAMGIIGDNNFIDPIVVGYPRYDDYTQICKITNGLVTNYSTSAQWNDKPGRTKEEVQKFLLKSADLIEVQ